MGGHDRINHRGDLAGNWPGPDGIDGRGRSGPGRPPWPPVVGGGRILPPRTIESGPHMSRVGVLERLSIQPSSSWAVEGEQHQILVRCDRERSGKLTVWLRSRGAGDWNGQGVDGENPDYEEGESSSEEHDDT